VLTKQGRVEHDAARAGVVKDDRRLPFLASP